MSKESSRKSCYPVKCFLNLCNLWLSGLEVETVTKSAKKPDCAVSVVIPAYNVEEWLGDAIASALKQTVAPLETIVVDDGSADGTSGVAHRFGERVRYCYQKNAGAAAARNRGIHEAQGKWIAFLDADDWWAPERLAAGLEVLRRHPELPWVAGSYYRVYADGTRVRFPRSPAYLELLRDDCYFPNLYDAYAVGLLFHTSTMLVRKDVLVEAGMFDTGLCVCEDDDLWFRIADKHPAIGYVNRPVSTYREGRSGSETDSKRRVLEWRVKLLEKRIGPKTRPEGDELTPEERFYCFEVYMKLKMAAELGDIGAMRHILGRYGSWLSSPVRSLARALCYVPPPLLRGVAQCGATLMRPLRLRHTTVDRPGTDEIQNPESKI